jgi:hypothetical protein
VNPDLSGDEGAGGPEETSHLGGCPGSEFAGEDGISGNTKSFTVYYPHIPVATENPGHRELRCPTARLIGEATDLLHHRRIRCCFVLVR